MTQHDWTTLYRQGVADFTGTPSAEMEQIIFTAFQQQPKLVTDMFRQVAEQVRAGTVASGWAVIAHRCRTITAGPRHTGTADDTAEKEKRIANTVTWLKNAGLHFDNERELLDEVFGDQGRLRAWKDDPALVEEIKARWRDVRKNPVHTADGVFLSGEDQEKDQEAYFAELNAKREAVAAAMQRKYSDNTEEV